MLRGGPVVVGVSLWFVSLPFLMHTQASKRRPCYEDYQEVLKTVTEKSKKWPGSRLYTPTVNDYMQNCSNSTLDCFIKESRVLLHELNMTDKKLVQDLRMLHIRINKVPGKNNCSHACELHTQMETQMFLNNLKEVITLINSEYCSNNKVSS